MPYNATLCKEALGKVFVALINFLSEGYFSGHTKTFGALARCGERRTKTLYLAEKSFFN